MDKLFKETIENPFNYKEIAYKTRNTHGAATKPAKHRQTIGGPFKNRKLSLKKTDPARVQTQDRCNPRRDRLLYANPLANLRNLIFLIYQAIE